MDYLGESVDTTDPNFGRLTGDDAILQQAIFLCLSTRRGALWSAPDYGCSLRAYLLAGLTQAQLGAIPQEVASALELDERIARADVSVVSVSASAFTARTITLQITVYAKGSLGQPYAFVALVSPTLVTVLLNGVAS